MPSLSKIGDLSCITSCLVLPGFLMDTLLMSLRSNISKTSASVTSGFQTRENWWKHEAALFLFFASFRRSKSAFCHLLCEATCSLRTDKQLGNVTSVAEYSKIVTAQQLGDRIIHIIHIFLRIMHISPLKYNSWIGKTFSNDNLN